MSTYVIENAKKFGDLSVITEAPDSATLLIHDGNGVKTISVANFKSSLQTLIESSTTELNNAIDEVSAANTALQAMVDAIAADGAGAHNAIYRGKYLGSAVTSAQYAAISAGTFDDMYIGDYWTIGGINYRIAAFDYYYRTGDTECTQHHITLVPDTSLYTHVMNDTNVTDGAYVNSKMYTTGLATAKSTINTAFGSAHVLNHRQYLKNATTNGYESGGSWYDSTVELMTEQNVYGGIAFAHTSSGTALPAAYTIDKSQYPLFALNPYMISNRQTFWLRDVVSAAGFAFVGYDGLCATTDASTDLGVRPAFSIVS